MVKGAVIGIRCEVPVSGRGESRLTAAVRGTGAATTTHACFAASDGAAL